MSDLFGQGWLLTVLQAQSAAMLASMQSVQVGIAQADAARRQAEADFACQQRMFEHLTATHPKD